MLRSVWAHLQPQHTVSILERNITQHDVPVVHRFRTDGQTAVNNTIVTILHYNVVYRSILRLFVSPCAFSAFYYDSIVVHLHEAVVDENIVAYVDVNSVS